MLEPAPVPLDIPALRGGINLSIREGEHLSILGPNGAGKSTLALTLAGLLYAPSGTLYAHEALREFDRENPTAESSLTREKTAASWDIPSWSPLSCSGASATFSKNPNTNSCAAVCAKNSNSGRAASPPCAAKKLMRMRSPPPPHPSPNAYV